MWLLRLPLFRNTRYRAASSSAVTSFVVVLPALPVIATTLAPDAPAHVARDVLERPRRVRPHSTITRRAAVRRRPAASSTSAPAAPRRDARRPTKCVPVEALAADRDEEVARRRASASRSRRAPIGRRRSPDTTRPPVAAATSPAVSATVSRRYDTLRAARRRASAAARHLDVVERQRPVADHLVLLVSLAGDQHEIARRARRGSPARSPRAVDDREARRRLRRLPLRPHPVRRQHDAALDLFDDPLRILASAGCRR